MRLHLSKCHIVGNHVSRLICLKACGMTFRLSESSKVLLFSGYIPEAVEWVVWVGLG